METAPIDVLLLDAQYRQALASMRAYARAGLRVGAVATDADAGWAPSTRSRWCSMGAVVPDFARDAGGYVDAVLTLVKETRARLVVPFHDGSIHVLRSRRSELESHAALGLGSEPALDVAVSKSRTLALASSLDIAIPRSVRVDGTEDIAAVLSEVGLPAVIKPEASWVEHGTARNRLSCQAVQSLDEAKRRLDGVFSCGAQALLQEWLPGRREAVSLFYAGGHMWARVAQVSHREWPVLGGVSVLCETIPLLADIVTPAERLVEAIGLEGCSMVEFRRNRFGHPVLMEVNPRMGGSVALAISAGVDFPGLLADWKLGRPLREVPTYRTGRRIRWLPGDIWNLKCVYDSQGGLDVPRRGLATLRFFTNFVWPRATLDVFERGDMRPGWFEMNRIVFQHAKGRVRRAPAVRWLASTGGEPASVCSLG